MSLCCLSLPGKHVLIVVCVCVGLVKGHKTEGKEFYYSVESEGKRQWHSRSAVILSLEQGNSLREQYGLGPYEPSAPLAKASDISLGKTPMLWWTGGQVRAWASQTTYET